MTDEPTRLGDVLDLKYGKGLPERSRIPGHVPVYGSSGVVGSHLKELVSGPGVVVGRKGSIGEVYWVEKDFFPIDTTYFVEPKSDETSLRFLFYLLRSLPLKEMNTDAAVPGLNRDNALRLEVSIPGPAVQEKIVLVTSKYDDLIENNRRRIALLEDAARQLYKEWFVRLRFPGHEHAPVVDGVPEGWTKVALREVLTLNYGKALKADDRIEGDYPVYGSSGVVGSHNKALTKAPGIIVGRKGNVGAIHWSHLDYHPIDTVYFVDATDSSFFIYHALLNTQFLNTDVAVPGLNRNFAYSREIVVPPVTMRDTFEEEVVPIYRQVNLLQTQNTALAKARDLLLPKLMSGEIAV
ncbi:restriction endonuclease subunit S [Ascidiaceihabitans sp.]|uniref:restriction endonuclease subunit S n=1 Tax=Ascidiaceihabitans sp. TaxID=1872644 RepID=UPI0032996088